MTSPVELINSLMKGDAIADLLEERVDVVIRVGDLNDSTMIVRLLSPFRQLMCASPDYLAANGASKHPTDLQQDNCTAFSGWMDGPGWTFFGPEGEIYVACKSTMHSGFGAPLSPPRELRYSALNS